MADNDMLGTLKGLLGDNADEKIGAAINALKGSLGNNENSSNLTNNLNSVIDSVNKSIDVNNEHGALPISFSSDNNSDLNNLFSSDGLEYMSRIKKIVDEMGSSNDPRSNLLMSLKPYMRSNRQKSIDNAVKILNLSRVSGLFKI